MNSCDRIIKQGAQEQNGKGFFWLVYLFSFLTSSWSNICCFSFSANWLCWLISSSCNETEVEIFNFSSQLSFDHFLSPLSRKERGIIQQTLWGERKINIHGALQQKLSTLVYMEIFWVWDPCVWDQISYFLQCCAKLCFPCFLGKNSSLLPVPSRII